MDLVALIDKASAGKALTVDEAEAAFARFMAGEASPVQVAALLVALRARGVRPSEIAGGVRALRSAMVPVRAESVDELVDTCGTGGGVSTFNISTAAALVAAGAGSRIAKHGNRSFTSRSGSADVLEALGVPIDLDASGMSRVLEEAGVVFMFAPTLHPAMRHVGPVRRELAIPTIMNLLGPLTNPAGARRQVVGVSDPASLELVAEGLRELGHLRALVVHGEPGMDELSPLGATHVTELHEGEVRSWTIRPEDLGLSRASLESLAGGEPEENAETIKRILEGTERGGPRSAVVLNAAAAIYVAGEVRDLKEGVRAAAEALDSGRAYDALEALRAASLRAAEGEGRGAPEGRS